MRHILFAAFGFFCVSLLISHLSYAAGNVLLPSSSASSSPSSTVPNLGISPTPAVPDINSAGAPAANLSNHAPNTPPGALIPPTSIDVNAPIPNLPQIPLPEGSNLPAQPNFNAIAAGAITSNVSSDDAKKLPFGQLPTTVIHQPDISPMMNVSNPNLPLNLKIAMGPKSYLGAEDVQLLSTQLGLSREQVNSQCYLTIQGMVQTDQGSYMAYGLAGPQVNVNYAGKITTFLMSVIASCTANNLPQGIGFITETKGRYIIPLQGVSCDPPNRQVSQLIITYTGTANSQCTYQ